MATQLAKRELEKKRIEDARRCRPSCPACAGVEACPIALAEHCFWIMRGTLYQSMHVLGGTATATIPRGRSELRNLVHCPGLRGKTPTSGTCSNVVIYGALRRQHAAWLLTLSAGCAV